MNKHYVVGDKVNYHLFIGGPIKSTGHTIKAIELQPNNYGADVAWISEKSGCVDLEALSINNGDSNNGTL